MANINGLYDPESEPQQDLGKLPTGEYLAHIIESDVENKENGTSLKVVYEVIEGPLKGRRHWHYFTLQHTNEKAQEMGNRQFASLRDVTGEKIVRDTQKLHRKPHIIRIEFSPAGSEYTYGSRKGQKRQYDDAEIKAWKKTEGVDAVGETETNGTQAAATSGGAAPWKRAA